MENDHTISHILMHAIGMNKFGERKGERNHFVSESSGRDLETCLANVGLGLMEEITHKISPALIGGSGSRLFVVTKDGFSFAESQAEKAPKKTRSQRRYLRWLEYSDCFDSFKDFLKWDADPERSWNRR